LTWPPRHESNGDGSISVGGHNGGRGKRGAYWAAARPGWLPNRDPPSPSMVLWPLDWLPRLQASTRLYKRKRPYSTIPSCSVPSAQPCPPVGFNSRWGPPPGCLCRDIIHIDALLTRHSREGFANQQTQKAGLHCPPRVAQHSSDKPLAWSSISINGLPGRPDACCPTEAI
jgi:hypothetical protein